MASLAPSPKSPAGEPTPFRTLVWAAGALVCSALLAFWASSSEGPPASVSQPPATPSAAVHPRAPAPTLGAVEASAPRRHRPYSRAAGRPLCRAGAPPEVEALCRAAWVRAHDYRARLLYRRVSAHSAEPARVKARQLRWQARIEAAAADPRLVRRLYLRRIRELRAEIAPPLPAAEPETTLAAEPQAAAPATLLLAAPPPSTDLVAWSAACVAGETPPSDPPAAIAPGAASCAGWTPAAALDGAPSATGPPSP